MSGPESAHPRIRTRKRSLPSTGARQGYGRPTAGIRPGEWWAARGAGSRRPRRQETGGAGAGIPTPTGDRRPSPTSRQETGDSRRLGDSGIWDIEGRERPADRDPDTVAVRPGAAPAPRFRAVYATRAGRRPQTGSCPRLAQPTRARIMLNEGRRRTAPRSDERGMVRRRHSCCAYPIPRLPDIGLAHRAALLIRALTCPPDGSRRGETAPSRCAVW
jgi:hypothetical protein